jgi:hypothetical protein
VIYLATVMVGELGTFLIAAAIVRRPRPDVAHLDHRLPTSAYPSGHTAAACCLYIAVAILVARGWWRWLSLIPAIAMPVLVALSRMYRGEHYPTDVLGSLLFSALWLTTTSVLMKPNVVERDTVRDIGVRAHLAGENAFSFGVLQGHFDRDALVLKNERCSGGHRRSGREAADGTDPAASLRRPMSGSRRGPRPKQVNSHVNDDHRGHHRGRHRGRCPAGGPDGGPAPAPAATALRA